MLEAQFGDELSVRDRSWALHDEEALGVLPLRCGKGRLEVSHALHVQVLQPQAQYASCRGHRHRGATLHRESRSLLGHGGEPPGEQRNSARDERAPFHYSTLKCASVVCPVSPLIGRISCGQAENATTRSISARKSA